jgi:hypothetical protein
MTLDVEGMPVRDAYWEEAWLPELKARLAAYERGETPARDRQDVLRRLRQSLDGGQSS